MNRWLGATNARFATFMIVAACIAIVVVWMAVTS